jgi:predicted transposase YdaD
MRRGKPPHPLDRSLKALIRRVPTAFLRLAGIEANPNVVRIEDVTINLPEFRADQVLIIGPQEADGTKAVHFEFQMQPDRRVLRDWFLKNAALTAQLNVPVALLAIYLERGRYRTFPAAYEAAVGSLKTGFAFDTIHLWEHADRIRGGELAELAPLLVLCEDSPTEQTLEEERRLILGSRAPRAMQADLLAVALTVGTRYFAREIVLRHFRDELQMLKEASIIEEWVEEAQKKASAEGRAKGRAEGRAEGARELLLQLLQDQFGDLPTSVVNRVNEESPEWCRETARRLRNANSLADLGL